ncbi:hypothetical protein QOT17_016816 [Balamuthia mandrillaris]
MEETKKTCFPFADLPVELQVESLKWLGLPGRDWLHCCLASSAMHRLSHEPTLWHHFCALQGIDVAEEGVALESSDWKALYLSKQNHLVLFEDTGLQTLVLSANKLTVTKHGGGHGHVKCRSARQWKSGKHYFEVTVDNTNQQIFIGILPVANAISSRSIVGHSTDPGWSVIPYTCVLLGNYSKQHVQPVGVAAHTRFVNGDVIGVYLDVDAGHLLYFRNGTYFVGLCDCADIRAQKPHYAAVSLLCSGEQVTFSFPPFIPESVRTYVNSL